MKRYSDLGLYISRVLFRSDEGLELFTLFRRSRVAFSLFSQAIDRLKASQVVEEIEGRIALTSSGRALILKVGAGSRRDAGWRSIPRGMLRETLDVSEFYIPSRKLLDRRTFRGDEERI